MTAMAAIHIIPESKRMFSEPLTREFAAATIKTAPPVTVWALTLNDIVALFTLGWVIIQAAYLIWKWRREAKAKKATP